MEPILLESEPAPGVVQLTLNRPTQRNALDAALIEALHAAFRMHGERVTTRAIFVAGSGTAFCAGADLPTMLALGQGPRSASLADASRLARMLLAIRESPKPTIALVHGPAFGGGVGLAAACDIALGSSEASFRLPEVRLGIMPATISPYVLEAMGARQSRRYWLSGELISAARACELGLLNEVVAPGERAAAALALAAELAQAGPLALAACKALITAMAQRVPNAATADWTAERLAELRASPEAHEGIAAALGRRLPAWRT